MFVMILKRHSRSASDVRKVYVQKVSTGILFKEPQLRAMRY